MKNALVPVEPTWEMQIRGRDAILAEDPELDLSTDDARAAYFAMLAAAPARGKVSREQVERVARLLCKQWDDDWRDGKEFHTANALEVIAQLGLEVADA